jgi:uncharacterized protein DUF3592
MGACVTLVFPAIGVLFAVLGGVFVVVGTRSARASREFERVAQRAPGVLTDVRYEHIGTPGEGSMHAVPIVQFTLPDGRTVRTEARMGATPGFNRTGTEITVLYDPADPRRARVDARMAGGGAFVGGCMASLGLTFVVVGIAVAIGGYFLARALP